jgi:hypothetical protein
MARLSGRCIGFLYNELLHLLHQRHFSSTELRLSARRLQHNHATALDHQHHDVGRHCYGNVCFRSFCRPEGAADHLRRRGKNPSYQLHEPRM